MQYLIGYDISDAKRLQKVHKQMLKYATPIQYSIFLFEGKLKELQGCLNDVLTLIHKKQDDLRVYPLPSNAKQWQIGKPVLPEGIIWTGLPLNSEE
ncbi:CRISPR-associated endonuclease Cas2 [Caviibacterium pharyngocola]|uniref:CRISPR-associated endoribonuclease Cas2 n=1 Tax=Caviibacterium pharyngocola TaxID=28159 RepID=A0A2M8RU41_9PAST|nr:CRISPR-associated endonuclease Cas2 [Caviibacterium pharyngocola]PJG82410.1 CRISPR-associated endonuclease Cas2 [Caviibacterium pharyngocola]